MNAWEIIEKESFKGITGYGDDADNMVKKGVIAGIKFLESNSEMEPERKLKEEGGALIIYPPSFNENADFEAMREVVSPLLYGGTHAMYEMAVSIVYFWFLKGTEEFLRKLRGVAGNDKNL